MVKARTGTTRKGGKGVHIKTAPVGSNSAPLFGQLEVMTVPEGQSSDTQKSMKIAALNGPWWKCVTLLSIGSYAGGAQEPVPQSRGTP